MIKKRPEMGLQRLIELSTMSYGSTLSRCTASTAGNARLYRHDINYQLHMDIPLHGKRTGILVVRRRYQCQTCHHSFVEPLPDMHPHHRMTNRLVSYIEQEAGFRTFASIAFDVGSMRRRFA